MHAHRAPSGKYDLTKTALANFFSRAFNYIHGLHPWIQLSWMFKDGFGVGYQWLLIHNPSSTGHMMATEQTSSSYEDVRCEMQSKAQEKKIISGPWFKFFFFFFIKLLLLEITFTFFFTIYNNDPWPKVMLEPPLYFL